MSQLKYFNINPISDQFQIFSNPGLDVTAFRYVLLELWGAGGGGAYATVLTSKDATKAGQGGGGAGYIAAVVQIPNMNIVVSYKVGKGGIGGTSGNGGDGGDSAVSVGNYASIVAKGGKGTGIGGQSFSAVSKSVVALIQEIGGSGDRGNAYQGGGGGSGCLPSEYFIVDALRYWLVSNPAATSWNASGVRGASYLNGTYLKAQQPANFGTGGDGGAVSTDLPSGHNNGNPGTSPGGGGGGGGSTAGSGASPGNGGAGGNGMFRITLDITAQGGYIPGLTPVLDSNNNPGIYIPLNFGFNSYNPTLLGLDFTKINAGLKPVSLN